jgi:hypothetical protein
MATLSMHPQPPAASMISVMGLALPPRQPWPWPPYSWPPSGPYCEALVPKGDPLKDKALNIHSWTLSHCTPTQPSVLLRPPLSHTQGLQVASWPPATHGASLCSHDLAFLRSHCVGLDLPKVPGLGLKSTQKEIGVLDGRED